MERWQDVDRAAIEEWNTRALILSAEEIKKWRKTHEVGKDLH